MRLFYPVSIFIFILFVGNTFYHHFNPKSAKSFRLGCHKEVTTFERLYEPSYLVELKEALQQSDFQFKITIAKSHYMLTRIDSYMPKEKFEQLLETTFGKPKGGRLSVNVLLYENDKDDPKKRTKKAKLYAGYLQMSFYIEQKRIYTVQIDYMDAMGKDIKKRLECALHSVKTL
jgi:hypothetical protein